MTAGGRFVSVGEAFAHTSLTYAEAVVALTSMSHPRFSSEEDGVEACDVIAERLASIRTNFGTLLREGGNTPESVATVLTQYMATLVLDLTTYTDVPTRVQLVYRAHKLSLPSALHDQWHRELDELKILLDEMQLREEIALLEAEGWPEGGAA